MKNSKDFNNIVKLINDKEVPISYIHEGRYLNTYFKTRYTDNKYKYEINNRLWLPIHPASLFQPLSQSRRVIYNKRWIERNRIFTGWIIYEKDSHWNDSIVSSVKEALKNYKIYDEKNYGRLKAFLYKKNNE